MKRLKLIIAVILASACIYAVESEFRIVGVVESIRKDGNMTLLLDNPPEAEEYIIFNEGKELGRVHTLRLSGYSRESGRYTALYEFKDESTKELIKAGTKIAMKPAEKKRDMRTEKTVFKEKPVYKTVIVSLVDNREMALISRGKFIMGSNNGDADEYPEHKVNLTEYYIDRFEVSNEDYRKYADEKAIRYPEYWKGKIGSSGEFNDLYFSRIPVIVSYHEAEGYAKWAGKRLPDEMEWEKAARFPPDGNSETWSIYTYGNVFKTGFSNTEEFWESEKIGENLKTAIKEKYKLTQLNKGLIPVDSYETGSVSFYGIVHMDGNASEWTSSWYDAYSLSRKTDKRYGTQYKVIRGGSFNLGKKDARVTDRKIGGVPNLYIDRIAGFRCVKDVSENDRI